MVLYFQQFFIIFFLFFQQQIFHTNTNNIESSYNTNQSLCSFQGEMLLIYQPQNAFVRAWNIYIKLLKICNKKRNKYLRENLFKY